MFLWVTGPTSVLFSLLYLSLRGSNSSIMKQEVGRPTFSPPTTGRLCSELNVQLLLAQRHTVAEPKTEALDDLDF